MLGWFLYFKIAFQVSSLVLFTKGSPFEYLAISRSCSILEKKLFNNSAVLQVHYFQLNEFYLCQQPYLIGEVSLFSKIAYCLQRTFHLDFHNISFLFFLKERHKNFFFCRKMFCNLVHGIIAFSIILY